MQLLREVECRWCGLVFCVCRGCWRGQAYCSKECGKSARRRAHREAQQRYRRTAKGREAHRLAERRKRMHHTKKTMDDQTAIPVPACSILVNHEAEGCRFCGRRGIVVETFPRRGYAARSHGRHQC